MKNVVATIIKFSSTGARAVTSAISGVKESAGVATKGVSMLASSLGQVGGSLGHAARQVANFMWSIQQMGAIGGIMAGAQIAIEHFSKKYVEAVDKMKKAVDDMASSVHEKFEAIKSKAIENVNDQLAEATTKAAEAAKKFDTLAAAYMKVAQAKDAAAKAEGDARLSDLYLEKSKAMSGEQNADKRALIGAGYDVRIAGRKLSNVDSDTLRELGRAIEEEDNAKERAYASTLNVAKAEKAKKHASEKYQLFLDSGTDAKELKELAGLKKAAEKAYVDALNEQTKAMADAEAAKERVKQVENTRRAAVGNAKMGLVDAERTEKDLRKSQKDKKKKDEMDFAEFVRKQRENLDEDIRKRQEKDREREMQDELEETKKLANEKEKIIADAKAKAEASHDILANAAGMNQAADIQSAAQEKHMNDRFEKRSKALQERLKKVGGDPSKLGRLSNIDKATLDRMQAEKVKDDATSELKKLNQKFDKLTQELKAATQL